MKVTWLTLPSRSLEYPRDHAEPMSAGERWAMLFGPTYQSQALRHSTDTHESLVAW